MPSTACTAVQVRANVAQLGFKCDVGIAAHDVTAGNPFLHLASLKPGDTVTITTTHCVVTYAVTRLPYRVLYTDVGVLRPAGTKHTLTMITCWPVYVLYFVPHRTIVSAIEMSSRPDFDGSLAGSPKSG
jgi:LPXTG-site transpeptidase (sortase) family protein